MSTTNRRRGADFELTLLKYLRTKGLDAERLRLAGKEDEGDLVLKVGGLPFVFEAKNEKDLRLASYVREAEIESVNYARHRNLQDPAYFAAVVKKRNCFIGDSYVITPLHEFLRIIADVNA